MKFDSIVSVLVLCLATGIGAIYVPNEHNLNGYGMIKSPYNDNQEVIVINENDQVQLSGSLPDQSTYDKITLYSRRDQHPNGGKKTSSKCHSTPPPQNLDKPEGDKPSVQTPPTEKPEGQYPPTEKPGNQAPPTEKPEGEKPGNQTPSTEKLEGEKPSNQVPPTDKPKDQYPPTEKPGNQAPPTEKPEGEKPGNQAPPIEKPESEKPDNKYPPSQKPGGQKPAGQYPPTEKPGNKHPGGGEKPSTGGTAKGSCANIPAEPGMDIQKMLRLVNEARKGLQPLKLNESLIKAAVWQSRNQQKLNKVTHSSPDGKGMGARMRECGYTSASFMAENAAPGTTEEDAMQMWMDSTGHRRNILNPKLKEFGAARAGNYWTQTFGGSVY